MTDLKSLQQKNEILEGRVAALRIVVTEMAEMIASRPPKGPHQLNVQLTAMIDAAIRRHDTSDALGYVSREGTAALEILRDIRHKISQ